MSTSRWREEYTYVVIALAVAMFTTSASDAWWSASGWRDGLTRGLVVAIAAVIALRRTRAELAYVVLALVATWVRTFVIVPVVDGTMMPTLLGPNPDVHEALTLAWDHSTTQLWSSTLDFAMIAPGAVLVAAVRRVDSGARGQVLAGAWLVVITAIDVWLFHVSEHGGKQLVFGGIVAIYLVGAGWRELATTRPPIRLIALSSLVLVLSIAAACWLRYASPCDRPDDWVGMRRSCTFQL